MLALDDPRWSDLTGGYQTPYDPRPALRALEQGETDAWPELWDGLHHQGDVGTASYAAVPHLIRIYLGSSSPDWNAHGLIATIELSTGIRPDRPPWLACDTDSLAALLDRALHDLRSSEDSLVTVTALSIVALAKGLRTHAAILANLAEDELQEILDS